MSSKPWALFDLDDTLGGVLINGKVETASQAYFDCIDRFATYMSGVGFDKRAVKDTQKRIDMQLCAEHGFGSTDRFPTSFVQTYEELAGNRGGVHPAMSDKVYDIGRSVFTDYEYVMLPGAEEAVLRAKVKYNVGIVTKGNFKIQMRKLQDCGLMKHIDFWNIFVVSDKNDRDWNNVFSSLGLYDAPEKHWAIGNSLKSDVNIPLKYGTNGILVNYTSAWEFERADLVPALPGRQFHHIDTIDQVSEILGV